MRAVSKSNHLTAMVRRTERVQHEVNGCMRDCPWASAIAAVVSSVHDDIVCIPYLTIPTPAQADYLDTQYPGTEISWWSRQDNNSPNDPAQPTDGVTAL